jgi:hypothetical protein
MALIYVDQELVDLVYNNLEVIKRVYGAKVLRGICSKNRRIRTKKFSKIVTFMIVGYLANKIDT